MQGTASEVALPDGRASDTYLTPRILPIYRYHLALLLPDKPNDLCHPGRAPI
jgi:hypothetical protein